MTIIEENYHWASPLQKRGSTTHLILHHEAASGSTVQDIHRYHRSLGWKGIAYHYYVRKDGSVYRGRPEDTVGGHTKDWNGCSIGICFEGNFEGETMGKPQKDAGRALVADIQKRYPGIVVGGHREFGATACPGRNFPLEEMKEAKESMDNTASSWAKEAVDWAKERGILTGDGEGNLKLHSPVTREEALTFLHRYDKGKEKDR